MIGPFLLARLASEELAVQALSRKKREPIEEKGAIDWQQVNLSEPGPWRAPAGSCVISLAPLWVLEGALDSIKDCRQIIAFSSTSVETKAGSDDPHERRLVARLRRGEGTLTRFCEAVGIPWTLLRPTLIYGAGRDQNISAIAKVYGKLRFFPLAGAANGLRQPVHAEDLALAALAAYGNEAAYNRTFNLAGGETLRYREMVTRVAQAMGEAPRQIHVPTWFLSAVLAIGARVGASSYSPGLAQRMNEDLVFDDQDARRILNHRPRPFQPELPEALMRC
ncbi:MAG: hypothetical protein AAF530_13365 [Pseudomonadota bacterium]